MKTEIKAYMIKHSNPRKIKIDGKKQTVHLATNLQRYTGHHELLATSLNNLFAAWADEKFVTGDFIYVAFAMNGNGWKDYDFHVVKLIFKGPGFQGLYELQNENYIADSQGAFKKVGRKIIKTGK